MKSFDEFKKYLQKIKLKQWIIEGGDSAMVFKYHEDPYAIPKFEVIVNSHLEVCLHKTY